MASSGATLRNLLMLEPLEGNLTSFKKLAEELDDGMGIAATVASIRSRNGLSVLHYAAVEGKLDICRYLIEDLKLDVNTQGDLKGETPLLFASSVEQKRSIVYLLKIGVNPNVRDEKGLTPLHHAIIRGHSDLVHLLLSHGADVNAISSFLGTPLERAANGMPEIVKSLLDHNADSNLSSSRAHSPIWHAVNSNSLQCVELLLEAGAHPDTACVFGVTPLLRAVSKGYTEIVRCLLKYGANPDLAAEDGMKPVEVAAIHANDQFVKILIPLTTPIPSYLDWSIDGVMKHVHSREVQVQEDLKTEEALANAKSKGDYAFREKDYSMAISYYNVAIAVDPLNAILLSNRSLCSACCNDGEAALKDAMNCILLKPNWPKGYYRAGVAWNILKKFDRAADSFFEGLKLDPENKELQKAYQEAVEEKRMNSF